MTEKAREAFVLPVLTNRQHTLFGGLGVDLLSLLRVSISTWPVRLFSNREMTG